MDLEMCSGFMQPYSFSLISLSALFFLKAVPGTLVVMFVLWKCCL